jgi:hypothetical protein
VEHELDGHVAEGAMDSVEDSPACKPAKSITEIGTKIGSPELFGPDFVDRLVKLIS